MEALPQQLVARLERLLCAANDYGDDGRRKSHAQRFRKDGDQVPDVPLPPALSFGNV